MHTFHLGMMNINFSPWTRVIAHRQRNRVILVGLKRVICTDESSRSQGRIQDAEDPPQEHILSAGSHIIEGAMDLFTDF